MGVPLSREKLSNVDTESILLMRAHPKSAILTVLSALSKTFSGFKSL